MIVISVLGILAAIALPTVNGIRDKSRVSAAATSMVMIAKTAKHYQGTKGVWPEDVNRSVLPPELMEYLPSSEFESGPLGGVWDYEDWRGTGRTAGGDRIGIAISIVSGDSNLYKAVDRTIDDGDLTTGSVRYCSSKPRLVYILAFD